MSLRNKMLLFSVGIVTALTALSLATIHFYVSGQVESAIQEDLTNTERVFDTFMRERSAWLRSQSWVVAEDPRFIAPLDIIAPDFDSQARTVLREAKRFQAVIGTDRFTVMNDKGQILAHVALVSQRSGHIENFRSVHDALQGRPSSSRGLFDGRPLTVVSIPWVQNSKIISSLNVGFEEPVNAASLIKDFQALLQDPEFISDHSNGAQRPPILLSRQLQRTFLSDLAFTTDVRGQVTGLVVRNTSYGEQVQKPALAGVLQGKNYSGIVSDDGHLLQRVQVPVWSQGEIVGVLVTGFEIDDRLALDLREMTRSEVTFLVQGQVVASSLEGERRNSLVRVLSSKDLAGRRGSLEIPLGSETYQSLHSELSPGGKATFLIQRSLDQAIGYLLTLEKVLLGIGLVALAAATAISYVGTSRIIQPLKALLEGTRKLASGDLSHQIDLQSENEVGELARAFNEMATSLEGSRQALTESEGRYRDLFDNAQDVVYTADLELNLTSVNRVGLSLFGYANGDLMNRSLYDLVVPDDVPGLRQWVKKQGAAASSKAMEVRFVSKSDEIVTLEILHRWIFRGDLPIGVHGIGRDISERLEREQAKDRFKERMHQSEKLRALGEMAAGVAHNFNNLLTGIIGYSEVLQASSNLPSETRKYIARISESGQRCAAIVRRIQKFGRPSDSHETQFIDLNHVIRDTLDLTRPRWKNQAEREGQLVEVKLELSSVPPVESTAAAWEEIISNLVFNAVDAMPEGGDITIKTWQLDSSVFLQISDTGTGMDQKTRRKIFEPFFSTKGPDLGTGLGLSTVWGLVQSQKSTIEVESELGRGTTFTIRIPIQTMKPKAIRKSESETAVTGLRVLLVDDESSVREVLAKMLKDHHVCSAANAKEALEKMEEQPFDILLTDWSMEGISGVELASEVKRLLPHIITVLVSGWTTTEAPKPEIDFVLPKPVLLKDLQVVMRKCMQLAQKSPQVGSSPDGSCQALAREQL